MENKIIFGDCIKELNSFSSSSVDAIITDPPYPEIKRDYGKLTEQEWIEIMRQVVIESRRILKPNGSAVFILQTNSEELGKTRLWLWKFLIWCGENWNIVQDVYWWNLNAIPTKHCDRNVGLMRPSVKMCVWLGAENCYRNQDEILWKESDRNKVARTTARFDLQRKPSGHGMREGRCSAASASRGGVTPFNLLPIGVGRGQETSGAYGHGAGTPKELLSWWIRYICPLEGIVLDPFIGTGTTAISAIELNRKYIGIEKMEKYYNICLKRIKATNTIS